ncbi:hypothetical protein FWJ25_13435 [Marinobacter salinexigens]|uniref:Uncharacterized protein n=1 Tax=Marinobacter salinexigens TaxID=2919747 RepID=A0A5B0VDN7_9GAMM|nr:hypothetical protein [Marinobacter salinexigens]KAA1172810.1 hypothetical protein FWJ25_13435 [Marinobacter salinexigens]
MANSTEKTVIQALLKKQPPELCGQPLFSGFESEDAILAAFVERGLNPEQEQAVKEALSTNPLLRQQWQSVREARARQPAVGRTWLKPGLALGGVGMVASLALVVVMVWTGKEPEPQLAAKREVRALANVASAPDYAAQPVPLSTWTAFLRVYAGEQSPATPMDKSAQLFAELAEHLRTLESGVCRDGSKPDAEDMMPAQSPWALLAKRFNSELGPLTPKNDADWCQLGSVLKQKAQQALIENDNQSPVPRD